MEGLSGKAAAMEAQFSISAKALGELALPTFCPYCFWVRLRVSNKLPFQIFPGIFSSIDSYTKNIVHNWFDTHSEGLPWLNSLGDIARYEKTPHYTKFLTYSPEFKTVLNGTPDDIFLLRDGSHIIVDYKTAKFTGTQDSLLPMYKVQLNAYGLIGKDTGFDPISKLALIYMEPVSLQSIQHENKHHREDGFNMVFSAKVLHVDMDYDIITPLLKEARAIFDSTTPPAGKRGCEDCQKLDKLTDVCRL